MTEEEFGLSSIPNRPVGFENWLKKNGLGSGPFETNEKVTSLKSRVLGVERLLLAKGIFLDISR